MVPLPLFKLASLLVRHVSKYGANRIKAQAHDHPRFRAFAAKYGQAIHQLNMKMSVALLRDPEAERRAKEIAEAPTVKTQEQAKKDEEAKQKAKKKNEPEPANYPRFTLQNVWRRKFRPLPEAKAVDLFADVAGDTFILTVAGTLIIYEYWKSSQKPDANKERFDELNRRFEELQKKEEELADAEEKQRQRFESLEEALRALKDPKTKQPLLPERIGQQWSQLFHEPLAQVGKASQKLLKQDPDTQKAEADVNCSPETTLDGYDVSFALAPQGKHHQSFFRILLLSSEEAKTTAAKAKIERLSMLDGGKNVAVMLLLDQSGRVDSLVMQGICRKRPSLTEEPPSIVTHGMASVPIIPMSSAAELVGRLDALRRQCAQAHTASVSRRSRSRADAVAEIRGLASHCVHGQALPREHVDILTDVSAGLGSLAQLVFSADGQRKICDLLGDAQGGRVISFFTHGHEANRRLGIWGQAQPFQGERDERDR
ncbi:uncharacterized protein Triagg1_9872 [Trichoderma aggressivum f. europaeum]|uniref:Uncharacterized protein n=1 Tax=Trichoderma aggressivum f. europaeum TaxID=173218 RepID=A0AAE1I6D6_9HYPO|nr:hypothetical protein Triagg1_9872 [Trichoderma aggressivum f. europaeum]